MMLVCQVAKRLWCKHSSVVMSRSRKCLMMTWLQAVIRKVLASYPSLATKKTTQMILSHVSQMCNVLQKIIKHFHVPVPCCKFWPCWLSNKVTALWWGCCGIVSSPAEPPHLRNCPVCSEHILHQPWPCAGRSAETLIFSSALDFLGKTIPPTV